nr:F-box/LRR-repeat protein At3g58900 [Arachis hypogaea]
MDRFSALPKIILHDILVRLPVKDAAKTSVLSKAWNDTWFSFPNLSVCSEDFFSEDDVPAGNRQRFRKLDILINYILILMPTDAHGVVNIKLKEKVESLSLQGLQKLKKVDVEGIQEVHIDSPSLEELCYQAWDLNAPFKLNFDSCTNLRCLELSNLKNTAIADKWFLELFSKFPFIESLKLFDCSMSERINISSSQLKILQLMFCSKLKEVNVDAPNLLLFDYRDDDKPVISFMRSSNQLEVNISTNVDFRHFYSLREFTRNMPQVILASLSLSIGQSFPGDDPYMPALLVSSTTPPSIKHLVLREYSPPDSEALYSQLLMNYLLSNCFPKTISFIYHRRFSFIEFFYEKLMGSEKGECYCSSGDRKCWWHALKIVNISCSFMTDENADFKAMLDASARSFEEKTITFSLEL